MCHGFFGGAQLLHCKRAQFRRRRSPMIIVAVTAFAAMPAFDCFRNRPRRNVIEREKICLRTCATSFLCRVRNCRREQQVCDEPEPYLTIFGSVVCFRGSTQLCDFAP